MRQLYRVSPAVAVLALLSVAAQGRAAITYDASNRPQFIDDLNIGGMVYDVTIHFDTSFIDLFGDPSAPTTNPTFWGDLAGAGAAASAIASALMSDLGHPALSGWYLVWSPESYSAASSVINAGWTSKDGAWTWSSFTGGVTSGVAPHEYPNWGWATFARQSTQPPDPTIPEPASFAVFAGLALFGTMLCSRRRDSMI